MTRGEAVTALLDTWVEELGDDAAQGLVLGLLLARSAPTLAEVVEQGVEEMAEGDVALANQAAREQWCAALRAWLREPEVAACCCHERSDRRAVRRLPALPQQESGDSG